MKTATTFSSGFVTCLAAVSIACGGGGGVTNDDGIRDDGDGDDPLPMIADGYEIKHGSVWGVHVTGSGNTVNGEPWPMKEKQ